MKETKDKYFITVRTTHPANLMDNSERAWAIYLTIGQYNSLRRFVENEHIMVDIIYVIDKNGYPREIGFSYDFTGVQNRIVVHKRFRIVREGGDDDG